MTAESVEHPESAACADPLAGREALMQRPRPWKLDETLVAKGAGVTSAGDLDALCGQRLSDLLLVLATWSPGNLGSHWLVSDSTFLVVSFDAAGCSPFVQFLSEPIESAVLCEVSSTDYDEARATVLTPEKDKLLLGPLGFEKREPPANYRREVSVRDESEARRVARSTAEVLVTALGYDGSSDLTASLVADRAARPRFIHERLHADELRWLLGRWGRRAELLPRDKEDAVAPVQWNFGGVPVRATLSGRVKRRSLYRQLTLRAHVRAFGKLDASLAHRWNTSQRFARAVPDGRGNLVLILDLSFEGGVTEEHLQWLVGLFELHVDRLRDVVQAGLPLDDV